MTGLSPERRERPPKPDGGRDNRPSLREKDSCHSVGTEFDVSHSVVTRKKLEYAYL